MAAISLPTNIDFTYADSGTDATVKLHQQIHDTDDTFLDQFALVTQAGTLGQAGYTATVTGTPAKGDILVGDATGTLTRLVKGTDGYVLFADSTKLLGVAWEDPDLVTQITQTGTAYTFALADAGNLIEFNNAAAVTVTVPTNASVAFPVGSVIQVRQFGAGQVSFTAPAGVNIRSRAAALKLAGQYSEGTLIKRASNEWILSGDITT